MEIQLETNVDMKALMKRKKSSLFCELLNANLTFSSFIYKSMELYLEFVVTINFCILTSASAAL